VLPVKGQFGIFNRAHYENVLVTTVHPAYLMAENLLYLSGPENATADFREMRFDQIRNFEKELAQNGTVIFKFYLHLGKELQKNRLIRRLQTPEKNWKFAADDLKERKLRDKYMSCYQDAIQKTTTDHALRFIIPADDKPMARLTVCDIMNATLSKLTHVQTPPLDEEKRQKLNCYIKELNEE